MTYVIDKHGVVRGVIEDVAPGEHAERALDLVRGLA
jgi:peroxiredoxin